MTRERKTDNPVWTPQETARADYGPLIRAGLLIAAILTAGFVWFVATLLRSESAAGRVIYWLLVVLAVCVVLASIGVLVAGVRYGWNRSGRVKPEVDGRFPMLLRELDAGASPLVMQGLVRGHVLDRGRALPPGVQSVSSAATTNNMGGPFYDEEPEVEQDSDVLTWASLVQAGEVGGGRDPIFGLDTTTGELVRLNWEHGIGSIGIYGKPHSGKTVLGVVLGVQAVADGGKLIVCDRHAGDVQSFATRMAGLESAYLVSVAQSEKEIVSALAAAVEVLNDRMNGNPDRSPVLVMGEELTAMLIRMRDKVEPPMTLIGVEGRKYGVNIVTMAQAPQKELVGLFRDISMSAACFRHTPAMGRLATGMNVRNLLEYRPGECCLMAANGDMYERVRVPEIVPADVVSVTTNEPATLPRSPRHLAVVGSTDERRWGMALDDPDQFTEEEERRIVALRKLGKQTHEIVWELRKVSAGGRRRYIKLRDAVDSVVSEYLRSLDGEEEL